MKALRFLLVTVFALTIFFSAGHVEAAGMIPDDCVDFVELGGFTICFLGKVDDQDGFSTWMYAIQSDGESSTGALSHWSIKVCPSTFEYVQPGDGETYTTLGAFGDFTGRPGIDYTVGVGIDPTTGVSGIKFEEGEPNLGEDGAVETDIFQFRLPTENTGIGEIPVAVKNADSYTGTISGPEFQESTNSVQTQTLLQVEAPTITSCDVPTAVNLTSFQAQSGGFFGWLLAFFGLT
jgi:hypothetical protein